MSLATKIIELFNQLRSSCSAYKKLKATLSRAYSKILLIGNKFIGYC
jgi:hypothetical protein